VTSRLDGQLKDALSEINRMIDVLHEVERKFLFVDANKKAILAALILEAPGKSFSEREAHALSSAQWKEYITHHAEGEADYLRAKRRYDLVCKAYDAAHLSLKTETSAIRRSGT
jgi:hypothetical protein